MNYRTLLIERIENYAIVTLNQGKVNAINTPLAQDLLNAFKELAKDDSINGVILAGKENGFSAGLDVMEMASGGIEGAKIFWTYYLNALREMIKFSKPFVCAITGFAPAGATILTLCADYRIMARGPKNVVGMHEFKMSMLVPDLLCRIYAYHLGEKRAWEAVIDKQLFTADEAVEVGLINEACDPDEVIPKSINKLKEMMQVYLPVYSKTKKYLRRELHQVIEADINSMVEELLETFKDPRTIEYITKFMMSLKN